jgi:DNA-binding MarR family transcriptional regulator
MPDDLSGDELAAYFALRRAGDHLQRRVTAQLREHGLTEVQFSILATLGGEPDGVPMSRLASALVASRSGSTYQVAQLAGRGLVERIGAASDERSVVARITPDGRALLDRVLPGHVDLVRAAFLDRSTPEELRVVREVLERVVREGS